MMPTWKRTRRKCNKATYAPQIWMTTAQAGFPLTREEEEVTDSKDVQMKRTTVRYLHPTMSTFIADWEDDLTSSGKRPSPLEEAGIDLENE
jgi:hypothetical protein